MKANKNSNLEKLQERISQIEQRNIRVEADKAWETSSTRVFTLGIGTYLIVGFIMMSLGIVQPWLNALIPTAGFIISTLTIPALKRFWLKFIYKK